MIRVKQRVVETKDAMLASLKRRRGNQWQGGGLSTSLQATRHSTRLNSNLRDKDAKVNEEAKAQETNPFHALQMEEDEESEDEESEEIKDMQTLPARPATRTPQRRTQKRSEREDSSVGQCAAQPKVVNWISRI